ncbi:MAG: hypothetical protein JNM22_05560 [Saprospiraceae bacterium]|nr:hypothetical protein [Saprospiraceae bacterium]
MTALEVLQFVTWPPCPIRLPEQLSLGPHGTITSVADYIAIQVSRADSDCERLRSLHQPQLTWIAREVEKFNQLSS